MPDGDQGYPGNREVTVTYSLAPRGAKLSTSMTVTTDKATPVNMLSESCAPLGVCVCAEP